MGDWSEEPDDAMIARFQPAGEPPVTATPGASIGYWEDDGPWRLYVAPIDVPPGTSVTAKAVRYGWQKSAPAMARIPIP